MSYNKPDNKGRFGKYGGKYIPETLMPAIKSLERIYNEVKDNVEFQNELAGLLKNYSGRPTPLYYASRISSELGYNIYLKREDLNHTGAHKINNALGQILLAKKMGKTRIIAETGAGMHGVATATVAAQFGLRCVIYMGEEDIRRQKLNVFRMNLLGAEVRTVTSGSRTLSDATNEAIRDWGTNVDNTYYLIRWQVTVTSNIQPFLERHQAEIKSIVFTKAMHRITWKDSWLPASALKDTCDELLGAYLLLKLYKCRPRLCKTE